MKSTLIVFFIAAALLILAACSGSDKPPKQFSENTKTCEYVPEAGQVFYWDVEKIYKGKKTHMKSIETIIARRGLLTIRLLEDKFDNGGVEVMNPIHYGPLYVGDLEDVVPIDMVVDADLYAQEFSSSPGILAEIEQEYRKEEMISAAIDAMDELAKISTAGTERAYLFARRPEVLSWRAESQIIDYIDPKKPTPMLVLDRIRTLGEDGDSVDTRSFWFAEGSCQMVRYSTSFIIPESSQSTESNLVKIEPEPTPH